jgi:short-subunit dehydrogenase
VVVCIGYLGDQAKGQSDWEEARLILETNFTGCVSALDILANHFELRRAGFICAISSVAGDRGRQSNYLYGAAKAGLSTYLEGLRNRLFPAHVRVITVKPGFVDTRMTYGRPGLFLLASPERVGKGIFRAIVKGKAVVYVPWYWRFIMLMVQSIPEAVFKRLRL